MATPLPGQIRFVGADGFGGAWVEHVRFVLGLVQGCWRGAQGRMMVRIMLTPGVAHGPVCSCSQGVASLQTTLLFGTTPLFGNNSGHT